MADPLYVAWRGVDPDRIDAATVTFRAASLTARGTSVTADYALDWVLTTGPQWVTESMSVRTRGDGWEHALDLRRYEDGGWSIYGFDAALDVDLGLCPFTNTMPVLRHDLVGAAQRGDAASVDLVMAWIDVPDLTVDVSEQRYTTAGSTPNGGALVRFESGDFEAMIEFDANGVVVDYPELATRLTP